MTNNALLIIDVQKGFINEYTRELPGKIEKLQNNYANVYAMQFINLEDSMFRKQLNWHKLSLNTQDTELALKFDRMRLSFQNIHTARHLSLLNICNSKALLQLMFADKVRTAAWQKSRSICLTIEFCRKFWPIIAPVRPAAWSIKEL